MGKGLRIFSMVPTMFLISPHKHLPYLPCAWSCHSLDCGPSQTLPSKSILFLIQLIVLIHPSRLSLTFSVGFSMPSSPLTVTSCDPSTLTGKASVKCISFVPWHSSDCSTLMLISSSNCERLVGKDEIFLFILRIWHVKFASYFCWTILYRTSLGHPFNY